MLERMWRKGNPLALLVGMQIDPAIMEILSVASSEGGRAWRQAPQRGRDL